MIKVWQVGGVLFPEAGRGLGTNYLARGDVENGKLLKAVREFILWLHFLPDAVGHR